MTTPSSLPAIPDAGKPDTETSDGAMPGPSRRQVLLGLVLGGTLPAAAAAAAVPTTGRAVVIDLNGRQHVFAESSGKNMGDYVGPFVRQRCIRVVDNESFFAVDFRPDVSGGREEVVIRYGMLGQHLGWPKVTTLKAANISTPFTVEIHKDGAKLATVKVPYMWWWSRFRWASAPRPVVRTAKEILSTPGMMLPFAKDNLYGAQTPRPFAFHAPMGDAGNTNTGLLTAMGGAGGRSDIGPVTEWQADWLINGTPSSLSTILAQGEAVATMPIHWIDDETGALVDCLTYPHVGINTAPGTPNHIPTANGETGVGWFAYESAHAPAASYMPYLLTDDPFFLENLQAQATYPIEWTAQFTNIAPGLVIANELRAWAWSMRSIFQARFVTPEKVPSWLKPRDYWERICHQNLTFFCLPFMNSPAASMKVFHSFVWSSAQPIWQSCFILAVLSWAVRMGFSEWKPFYTWFAEGVVPYMSGLSGWPRSWPVPYYTNPINAPNRGLLGLITDTKWDAVTFKSHAALWQGYIGPGALTPPNEDAKPRAERPPEKWTGDTIEEFVGNLGPDDIQMGRGAMALAFADGIKDADVASAFMEAATPAFVRQFGGGNQMRWSIKAPTPIKLPQHSPSNTTLPGAERITEIRGTVWTLAHGVIVRDGKSTGTAAAQMLYLNGIVYYATEGGEWFSHATGAWVRYGNGDPRKPLPYGSRYGD